MSAARVMLPASTTFTNEYSRLVSIAKAYHVTPNRSLSRAFSGPYGHWNTFTRTIPVEIVTGNSPCYGSIPSHPYPEDEMAQLVDLVADLGEGFGAYTMGDDEALLDVLTSANIACGFHAGDPRIMDDTVRECVRRGVAVGAHPSFPDLVGFGRRAMDLSPGEVRTDVLYQVGALQAFAVAHGTHVQHVAPHGRLGNLVAVRQDYADAVTDAVVSVDPTLIVLAQDGALADAARAKGLRVGIVGIADRAYRDDGTLV